MQEKYGLMVQADIDPLANSDRKDVRTLVFESLRELLFNAVKHAKVDRVKVDLSIGPNDTLCVTVTDQGVGFEPGELFSTPNSQNTGLGLFSIRERLLLLRGQLEIESSPQKGTRFRIVVPRRWTHGLAGGTITSSADASPPLPDAASGTGLRQLRILIVDDHAGVRDSLRQTLQDQPEFYVAGEASDGLEAIHQARNLQPDAIVMDISMPNMGGVEATRCIHAEFPEIQIFGLSSAERTEASHPIQEAGAADYFVKGIETHRLIGRLLSAYRALHAKSTT
jgi:CheY-like chemotaxis protein/anti-sigma regulatory factor (Ser/Thr protein kinase)